MTAISGEVIFENTQSDNQHHFLYDCQIFTGHLNSLENLIKFIFSYAKAKLIGLTSAFKSKSMMTRYHLEIPIHIILLVI